MATTKTLNIVRGKTLLLPIRWETIPVVSKPITAISIASGFPRLTVTGHGAPDGWRGYVTGVLGMKQINAQNTPPRASDFYEVTVIDANTIELNGVDPVDETGKEWPAYVSGGFFKYNTPHDLTSYSCEVVIKDKVGGTILMSSRAADAPLNVITATVDNAAKTTTIKIPATDAAAIAWSKAVWEAEMHGPDSLVEPLISPSPVVVSDEVAT